MIKVRHETTKDAAAVRSVNEQAFGQKNEADLVEALHSSGALTISLVATENDQVVGHIAFSPVIIESRNSSFKAVGLGPMAVLPGYQNHGIGSQLVQRGLEECKKAGHEIVVVLGYPKFYRRFGFSPSKPCGIEWEHDVPGELFMIKELRQGALAGRSGRVKYQPEFSTV